MAKRKGFLEGARVYLSGPMDFVANRADEARFGWRNRVGQFLRSYGAIVFDPWNKPDARGLKDFGREGIDTDKVRQQWVFQDTRQGARKRGELAKQYWQTLHIDLRMVDTSDFTIAYCPTNVYSVGTPHELALCRLQHKPVLFVSPRVTFPSLDLLRKRLSDDPVGTKLLESLVNEVPIKENEKGIPSLWYMPLIGSETFFDGFGFAKYRKRFGWEKNIRIDEHEKPGPGFPGCKRPLLPFLMALNRKLPERWDWRLEEYIPSDDWLLWDLDPKRAASKAVTTAHQQKTRKRRR